MFKHSNKKSICVRDALNDRGWVANIRRNPTRAVLTEYLHLWPLLDSRTTQLLGQEEDTVTWRWTANGKYSASSVYQALLLGRIPSPILSQVWKTKATPKCRMHAWLLLRNKCLTADNLAKRGWPHDPICKLCFIHPETAVHLAATCSYSQQVWQEVLRKVSLPAFLGPSPTIQGLQEWWKTCASVPAPRIIDRWRSVALLTWWLLWKERNNKVFNCKASPATATIDKITAEITQ